MCVCVFVERRWVLALGMKVVKASLGFKALVLGVLCVFSGLVFGLQDFLNPKP